MSDGQICNMLQTQCSSYRSEARIDLNGRLKRQNERERVDRGAESEKGRCGSSRVWQINKMVKVEDMLLESTLSFKGLSHFIPLGHTHQQIPVCFVNVWAGAMFVEYTEAEFA